MQDCRFESNYGKHFHLYFFFSFASHSSQLKTVTKIQQNRSTDGCLKLKSVYPAELQLNKANTSDKETSFLYLNIKVIGSDIHTSVYDKRNDFGFPIVNFPWLSGDVPRLPSYGIYISQLVRFARCCTSVLDFHYKNLQITSKLLTQGYRYHKLRKTFGKFFRSYSELLSKGVYRVSIVKRPLLSTLPFLLAFYDFKK